MKKVLRWVLVLLISLSFVSSSCIDINSASLEELDGIKWVGEKTAQYIIDERPFDSVDDLIRVRGIGEIRLAEIKDQGLACVDKDVEEDEEEEEVVEEEIIPEEEVDFIEDNTEEKEDKETETITLTAQTIKTPDNKKNKSKYAIFGFVGFCVLLGVLFMLKKKKYKNEFR